MVRAKRPKRKACESICNGCYCNHRYYNSNYAIAIYKITATLHRRVRYTLTRNNTKQFSKCEIVGYAYASAFHKRAAYQYAVSVSIYLAQSSCDHGIGTALYEELFAQLAERDIHSCLAEITLPNDRSIALHKKFGFEEVGILRSVGYKFDQWHDVMWMQKLL